MPRPNGPQFVHLYRGLADVEPDDVNYDKLGIHWTADPRVADRFTRWKGDSGVVIKARVEKRHLITPEHPNWKELQVKHSIFGPNSAESEYTVSSGSPIRIKRVYHIPEDDYMFEGGHDPGLMPNEEYETLSKPIPKHGTA